MFVVFGGPPHAPGATPSSQGEESRKVSLWSWQGKGRVIAVKITESILSNKEIF